jgi:hypothetical protein
MTRPKWSKPNHRKVKVNVDGSFHSDSHAGSAGVVLRNCEGRFIAATTLFFPNISLATTTEAIAMREGLASPG